MRIDKDLPILSAPASAARIPASPKKIEKSTIAPIKKESSYCGCFEIIFRCLSSVFLSFFKIIQEILCPCCTSDKKEEKLKEIKQPKKVSNKIVKIIQRHSIEWKEPPANNLILSAAEISALPPFQLKRTIIEERKPIHFCAASNEDILVITLHRPQIEDNNVAVVLKKREKVYPDGSKKIFWKLDKLDHRLHPRILNQSIAMIEEHLKESAVKVLCALHPYDKFFVKDFTGIGPCLFEEEYYASMRYTPELIEGEEKKE